MIKKVVLLGTPFFENELRSSLEIYRDIELIDYDGIYYRDNVLYLFF